MERWQGRGIGRIQPFAVGLLYVIVFSILAVVAMVKTKFNNRSASSTSNGSFSKIITRGSFV